MSLDFPNFEKMKRECPPAARYWRIGDRLYYFGLLSGIISALAFIGFRITNFAIAALCSVLVFALGIFLKRKSYVIANQSGCRFD
jgi:hypothetical protein